MISNSDFYSLMTISRPLSGCLSLKLGYFLELRSHLSKLYKTIPKIEPISTEEILGTQSGIVI
ncbi:hypothetical protein H6F88_24895 [Oculatella sp. FACHB-28]|uniref:hypothetical protein n=1 Tax=Cyanophyceae TaxID=3028117 RepID=UPI0016864795|nr:MULTISPECIES: hypothetical protein [Cyanophyceae]MBD2059194.1 hypothetical protein [Oculatella sp. FACHB-28]